VTKRRRPFDIKSFLARVGDGQSIGKYRKGQIVSSQGDLVDQLFNSSGKRLARLVLLLANFGKEAPPSR
jgi:CRP/FNR family transcriptional regulator, cyclic AMP receptor protein